ncbi:MAG: hypothetical protein Q7S86_02490 [bacterium]|nr:hypothetical protein [bacterium]
METCKKEWVEIALKYIVYSLRFHGVEPNSEQSRAKAEDMRLMISINAGELARFINSLLRGNIEKRLSFSETRASEIAVAWSWATKTNAIERLDLTKEEEAKLIVNSAKRIGVDPKEALAFNAYLETYELP